mgnify:FL=1
MKKIKNLYPVIFIVIFILIEALIIKIFYSQGDLLNFRSLFWIIREIAALSFLGIFYVILKEDIEYFDVFIIIFPVLGYLLLFFDKLFSFWTIPGAMAEEILYSQENDENRDKYRTSSEYFNVMSYTELLLADNSEKKKKVLYSYDPEEISSKTEVLKKALLDENIDVIHYAATELNKIDTGIQSEINIEEQEEKRNELKLYHLYKKYVDSGLLDGAIKGFYIGRLFNIFDNLELSEKEKEYELLYLYKKSNEKVKYEKLIKKVINNNPDSSVISEYLKFLHEENRFEDLLDVYRKHEKLNTDIVKPYILNEYI